MRVYKGLGVEGLGVEGKLGSSQVVTCRILGTLRILIHEYDLQLCIYYYYYYCYYYCTTTAAVLIYYHHSGCNSNPNPKPYVHPNHVKVEPQTHRNHRHLASVPWRNLSEAGTRRIAAIAPHLAGCVGWF